MRRAREVLSRRNDERGAPVPIWSRGFPRTLEAAGEARNFVRQVLRSRIPSQVLDDVLLMTSELAINSARHVPSEQGDWLEVWVDHNDEVLRVSVRDPGTDFDGTDIDRAHEIGGWGLRLVSGLSSRWGVAPSSGGTDVWFELDRPREGEWSWPAL
jgi:anti-sigma regulatory factor (Ser/Thr protein kinase)